MEQRHKNIFPDADNIPFLNGGLFEPHKVNDFYNGQPQYNLVIPDDWFEQFFGILEQYNFTIDENSSVDADVSVDPEMLGRIFENLLAEIDPTDKAASENARKASGSYYTPRRIVDFMVNEALFLHLKTRFEETGASREDLVAHMAWRKNKKPARYMAGSMQCFKMSYISFRRISAISLARWKRKSGSLTRALATILSKIRGMSMFISEGLAGSEWSIE